MYTDKTLTCQECSNEFVFTAGEQEFFATKGFENEPSRCPTCRAARKQRHNGHSGGGSREERQMYETTCAECGKSCEVPFRPTGDKPVYCKDCYQAKKSRW
jgi:CxxC-x17-CxxC domain-containing protein